MKIIANLLVQMVGKGKGFAEDTGSLLWQKKKNCYGKQIIKYLNRMVEWECSLCKILENVVSERQNREKIKSGNVWEYKNINRIKKNYTIPYLFFQSRTLGWYF